MDTVSIRPATSQDVDRMAEILNEAPDDEPVALMGNVELARRYGVALFKLNPIPSDIRISMVAHENDAVVGVLQYQFGESGNPHSRLAVVRMLISLVGPIGFLRRFRALRSRTRVDIPVPAKSLQIKNLHVATDHHGRGIGGQLLARAEQEGRRLGAERITVISTTNYPSLAWYERSGFKITRTVTDPTYERYTGIAGRLLLEKELNPAP
jgi:ribosomal protein S18 acetylase RimI-like enzyme